MFKKLPKFLNKLKHKDRSSWIQQGFYHIRVYQEDVSTKSLHKITLPNEILQLKSNELEAYTNGLFHYAAVINKRLYTWGNNEYGQLGPTNTSFSLMDSSNEDDVIDSPFLVPGAINLIEPSQLDDRKIQLAAGDFHTLLNVNEAGLWAWGAGILGRGGEVYDPMPQLLSFFADAELVVDNIEAIGEYSLAMAYPKEQDENVTNLLYIWGYLPNSEVHPSHSKQKKALYPAIVENLLNEKILKVKAAREGFLTLSTTEDKACLKYFGKIPNKELIEQPYYPYYDESAINITSYSESPIQTIFLEGINPSEVKSLLLLGNKVGLFEDERVFLWDLNDKEKKSWIIEEVEKVSLTKEFLIIKKKHLGLKVFNLKNFGIEQIIQLETFKDLDRNVSDIKTIGDKIWITLNE